MKQFQLNIFEKIKKKKKIKLCLELWLEEIMRKKRNISVILDYGAALRLRLCDCRCIVFTEIKCSNKTYTFFSVFYFSIVIEQKTNEIKWNWLLVHIQARCQDRENIDFQYNLLDEKKRSLKRSFWEVRKKNISIKIYAKNEEKIHFKLKGKNSNARNSSKCEILIHKNTTHTHLFDSA